jgi:predicted aminopeptidase
VFCALDTEVFFPDALIEAYESKNADAAAKQNILASLKRAFHSQFDKMQSDEVFIEKCEKWLSAHYPNVHINDRDLWLPSSSALSHLYSRETCEYDIYTNGRIIAKGEKTETTEAVIS